MYLQEAGEAQIGTAKDSGNDIFYSHLERLGLAREVPLGLDSPPQAPQAFEQLKTFTLTEPGKAELLTLIEGARKNGYPAPDSIVSPEAIRMLKQYAAQGDALSQGKLGLLYETGAGVQQDPAEALKWYQKAAEAGNYHAMEHLGYLYENGKGVAQDYAQARQWYQKAADGGNTDGMFRLGVLYENGWGVAKDYGKAREWYQKAADAGSTYAKQALSRLRSK